VLAHHPPVAWLVEKVGAAKNLPRRAPGTDRSRRVVFQVREQLLHPRERFAACTAWARFLTASRFC